mmetsp:Transcript_2492/g.5989  ORF Transcript_2492/g.5989 Transcript_2492/m.5989 type:complete len:157 (+) Transcript_2492:820-1290(+)
MFISKSSVFRYSSFYPFVTYLSSTVTKRDRKNEDAQFYSISSAHLNESHSFQFFMANSCDFTQPNDLQKTQNRQRKEGVTEPQLVSLLSWIGSLENIPRIPAVVVANRRPHDGSANHKQSGKNSSEDYLHQRKGNSQPYNAVFVIKVCKETKNTRG